MLHVLYIGCLLFVLLFRQEEPMDKKSVQELINRILFSAECHLNPVNVYCIKYYYVNKLYYIFIK